MSTVYAKSFLYSMWDRLFSALCADSVCSHRTRVRHGEELCGRRRHAAAGDVAAPLASRRDTHSGGASATLSRRRREETAAAVEPEA